MANVATDTPVPGRRNSRGPGTGLNEIEQTLLSLTDVMTRNIEVPASLYEQVRRHLDERQTVDLMVTIGAYNMVSRFLVALELGH